jgi:hypothetical protein
MPDNFNSVVMVFLNKHYTGDCHLMLQTVRKIGQIVRIIQASQGMNATEFMRKFDMKLDMQAHVTGMRNLDSSRTIGIRRGGLFQNSEVYRSVS